MSVVRTNAAAAMLGVSPNTLRSWERRFGYPTPRRTQGGHRQFELTEIEALRQAFAETQNISSAISIARERGEGPATPARLRDAFSRFDEDKADRLLEESLATRSVERTVQEVLLPTIAELSEGGPELGFAWRYATGWLAAALRVAPPAHRPEGVLVFTATAPLGPDALHVQGLGLWPGPAVPAPRGPAHADAGRLAGPRPAVPRAARRGAAHRRPHRPPRHARHARPPR